MFVKAHVILAKNGCLGEYLNYTSIMVNSKVVAPLMTSGSPPHL